MVHFYLPVSYKGAQGTIFPLSYLGVLEPLVTADGLNFGNHILPLNTISQNNLSQNISFPTLNSTLTFQVGFNAGDGFTFLTLPGSANDITKLHERSNVETPGKWVFRVDKFDIEDPACSNDIYITSKVFSLSNNS